jgi:acyl-coenzyme A thioesterase PaaI-like protein
MKNTLNASVAQLQSLPEAERIATISQFLGSAVKYVGTTGVQFEQVDTHEVRAHVENVEKVRNHIGQVHAAAMILLAETVTGIVVGMNIPDEKIPLIKSLNTRFVRRTEGRITAAATLTDAQIQHIETVDKGDVPVAVTVTDATGEEVILVEAVWAWIPKKR